MNIEITFEDGPIRAKIEGGEDEDFDEILDKLSSFVDEYSPSTAQSASHTREQNSIESDSGSPQQDLEHEDEDLTGIPRILSKAGITEGELQRVVKLGRVDDGDIKELPQIISDTSILGKNGQEKMVNASTIILTLLSDIYEIDRVKMSHLKSAVDESGVSVDNWSNRKRVDEFEVYLTSRGQGKSATTEIRVPGKDAAYDLLGELAEQIQNDED